MERDDIGNPLVGARLNDADVVQATRLPPQSGTAEQTDPELVKGMFNGFTDGRAAIFAASRMAGSEVVVIEGKKVYLYRVGSKLLSFKTDEEKLEALKAMKLSNGLSILGFITGSGKDTRVLRVDGK